MHERSGITAWPQSGRWFYLVAPSWGLVSKALGSQRQRKKSNDTVCLIPRSCNASCVSQGKNNILTMVYKSLDVLYPCPLPTLPPTTSLTSPLQTLPQPHSSPGSSHYSHGPQDLCMCYFLQSCAWLSLSHLLQVFSQLFCFFFLREVRKPIFFFFF